MAKRLQEYTTDQIRVTFDPSLCIHSAICLRNLPEVFDVRRRRWVALESGTTDDVARTVERCPSGALRYQRLDGGPQEAPDDPLNVRTVPNGPLYARGDLHLVDAEGGEIAHTPRAALCRCGESASKPFCDNTHRTTGFRAD